VRVARAQVSTPAVTSRLRTVKGVKIGYDAVAGFTTGVHGELRRAVDASAPPREGVLIDMRNNGGGLLKRPCSCRASSSSTAASSARRAACRERTGSTTPPAEH